MSSLMLPHAIDAVEIMFNSVSHGPDGTTDQAGNPYITVTIGGDVPEQNLSAAWLQCMTALSKTSTRNLLVWRARPTLTVDPTGHITITSTQTMT